MDEGNRMEEMDWWMNEMVRRNEYKKWIERMNEWVE